MIDMMRTKLLSALAATTIVAFTAAAHGRQPEGRRIALSATPVAVQKTIAENLDGGQIQFIGREKENGIEQYEVVTTRQGKERTFNISAKGMLLVVEEATSIESIPAAAQAAIIKRVATGKLMSVETLKETGKPLAYEATYSDRAGKHHEFVVSADGTNPSHKP